MPIAQSANATDLLAQAQHFLTRASDAPVDSEQESAWKAFHDYYTRKIRAFAFTCGATEAEVADCIQEVWAELLVRLPAFRLDPSRGSFDTWLFPIVRSKTADWLRHRRKQRLDHHAFEQLDSAADHRPPPVQVLEEAEIASLAWDHVTKSLCGCSLDVLKLRLLEQRPVAEVAEKLGITAEQVSARYHRARKVLERIGRAWSQGRLAPSPDESMQEEKKKSEKSAQEIRPDSVSRNVGAGLHERQGGPCVDYVFQRLELGRRELSPEWKVEWNCDGPPKAVLYIRKTAIVAYAEICAPEEVVSAYWPRIVNAAIAAGVAAGIATIISTPTAALQVFQGEFYRLFHGKGDGNADKKTQVALTAKVEPSGTWCECRA